MCRETFFWARVYVPGRLITRQSGRRPASAWASWARSWRPASCVRTWPPSSPLSSPACRTRPGLSGTTDTHFTQCCKTGTGGTVTFCLRGTGTLIKWNHKNWHSIKLCFWFPSFNIFSFIFYNKLDEAYQFFPCRKPYYVKWQDIFKPEPEP